MRMSLYQKNLFPLNKFSDASILFCKISFPRNSEYITWCMISKARTFYPPSHSLTETMKKKLMHWPKIYFTKFLRNVLSQPMKKIVPKIKYYYKDYRVQSVPAIVHWTNYDRLERKSEQLSPVIAFFFNSFLFQNTYNCGVFGCLKEKFKWWVNDIVTLLVYFDWILAPSHSINERMGRI